MDLGVSIEEPKRGLLKHVLLTAMHADGPARTILTDCLSHSAYLGCGFCLLNGVRPAGGGMYFVGYARPTQCGVFSDGSMLQFVTEMIHGFCALWAMQACAC